MADVFGRGSTDDSGIGELRFAHRGQPIVASLTLGLTWECNDQAMKQYLNETCRPDNVPVSRMDRTSLEEFGRHLLYRTASRVGGAKVALHDDGAAAMV